MDVRWAFAIVLGYADSMINVDRSFGVRLRGEKDARELSVQRHRVSLRMEDAVLRIKPSAAL